MPYPLIIQETTGPQRTITLQGRSMPYQDVNWGGTQRANIDYFPGNPVANIQVIGQTYKPTVLRGKWKDIFLRDDANAPQLINFPNIGDAGLPSDTEERVGQTFPSAGSVPGSDQRARLARTVRDAFELIRRSGQKLRVEWGNLVRFGILTDADFSHDRVEDIGFALEFTWSGDTDVQPRVRKLPTLDPLGLLKQLAKLLQELLNTLLQALRVAQMAVLGVTQRIRQFGSLVTGLIDVLGKFASLALVPAELIGTIRQQLTSISLAAKDLLNQLRSIPAAYALKQAGASEADTQDASAIAAAIAFSAQRLGAEAVQQRRQLEQLDDPILLGVYLSPGGVTLRDVASRFYGSSAAWTQIQDFNGFSSSVLPRGVVVRVPRLE